MTTATCNDRRKRTPGQIWSFWSFLPALTRPFVMTAVVVRARGFFTAFRRFPKSARWSKITELQLRLSSTKAAPSYQKMDYQVSR